MASNDRITISHEICEGKPVIKGTRISVDFIIELLGNNWTHDDILENYPQLDKEDILAALKYASGILKGEHVYTIPPRATS
jgi:uncharacterized protein (DUF433 family)